MLYEVITQDFFKRLDAVLELAKNSLEIKRKILETYTENDLFPYTKYYLAAIKGRFNKYWENHFSTIGIIGMNEACLNLFEQNIASPIGQSFSAKVMDYLRQRIVEIQDETRITSYNVCYTKLLRYAVPSPGVASRLKLCPVSS